MAIYSEIFNQYADRLKQEWDAEVYGQFFKTAATILQDHATTPPEISVEQHNNIEENWINDNLENLSQKNLEAYRKEVDSTLELRESLLNNKTGNQDTYDRYFAFLNQCAQDSLTDHKALCQSFEDGENDPQRTLAFKLGAIRLNFNKIAATKATQHMVPFTGQGLERDRRAFLDAMIDAHTLTRAHLSKTVEQMMNIDTLDVKTLYEEYQAETAKIFKRVEKQGDPLTPIKGSNLMIFSA